MAISSLSVLAACVSNQPHHSRRHREQANPIRRIIEIMDVKENMAVDYGKYDMESLANIDDFDKGSGSWFERLLFNNRVVFLLICVTITAILGFAATQVRINADFNDTIPTHQPYIRNYLQHFSQLQLGANSVQIAVTANQGAIIDKHYL